MPPNITIPTAMAAQTGKAVTAVAATDIFTAAAHGYAVGNSVIFSALTGGAGITPGTVYYVIAANLATNTFSVSTTPGGAALDVTSDLTAGTVTRIFNWADLGTWFTLEMLEELAKYFIKTTPTGALGPGTIIDNNVVRNYYQFGFLP